MKADIVIVGGGIVGRSIAFELARARVGNVVVLDHGALGGEASPAAAGFLPQASIRARHGPRAQLLREGVRQLPTFIDAVRETAGGRACLMRPGLVELAATGAEAEALERHAAWCRSHGWRAECLEGAAVRNLVPGLAASFLSGLHLPEEAWIDPGALLADLATANERLGVRLCRGVRVHGIEARAEGGARLRVDGGVTDAAAVVVAAGWWSRELLLPLGARLPVRPARGEMVALARSEGMPRVVVAYGETRLYPHPNGELWLGASVEYDAAPQPTPALRDRLLSAAARVIPGLRSAAVTRHWAGVRPCSGLHRPIVGGVPGAAGVYVACGHHRDGYVLAPLTAMIVRALLCGGPAPAPLELTAWQRRRVSLYD